MNEPRQRIIVDSVAFGQIFHFHRILRTITQSMQPPRLLVALLIVLSLIAVGNLWDRWFEGEGVFHPAGILVDPAVNAELQKNDALRPMIEGHEERRNEYFRQINMAEFDPATPLPGNLNARTVRKVIEIEFRYAHRRWEEEGIAKEIVDQRVQEFRENLRTIDSVTPRRAYEACSEQVARSLGQVISGVFHLSPTMMYAGFEDLLLNTPVRLWTERKSFVVWYGLFALIVLSVGGGALCRMSVCEISGRERLRATDAFDFALNHWVKLVLAPLTPLLIAGVLSLVLAAAGVALFELPFVDVLGGLLYGINLLLGFLIAFVLLATAGSYFMLIPAVATENCGPVDALQRAFAYLISRPMHLLGYVITGLVGLAIGYIVVALVAVTTMNVAGAATGAFTDATPVSITGGFGLFSLEPAPGDYHDQWHDHWSAFLVAFWQGLIILLVVSYVVSYLFSCSASIYMLMRKTVDDQDFAEIWRPGLIPGTLAPMPTRPRAPSTESTSTATAPVTPAAPAAEDDDDEDDA